MKAFSELKQTLSEIPVDSTRKMSGGVWSGNNDGHPVTARRLIYSLQLEIKI